MNPSVILGQVSLSFYAVTGAVVHAVLERLGHAVEVRQGPHEEMFPLLCNGSIDLMAAAWLPEGHAAYWSKYGAAAREVATLYDGARFFWGAPDYVPPEQVGSIADLSEARDYPTDVEDHSGNRHGGDDLGLLAKSRCRIWPRQARLCLPSW
jgi:glycine betaine/proline transport system substrate-binding protein